MATNFLSSWLNADVFVKASASPGIGVALINGILYCRQGETEDKGMAMRFVVCLSREGFGEFSTDDLTLGRLYEVLAPADSHSMLRIIDDSGEDFLYPASLFEAVEVQEQTATRLHELLAA
ncbi:MAG: hypothetical protein ABTS16_00840 [Candidatus Accumulibacter phosphatis]|jgi:hypothetical protein|nr:hypothetical protein [Candidatus Accumulibacter contiguus]